MKRCGGERKRRDQNVIRLSLLQNLLPSVGRADLFIAMLIINNSLHDTKSTLTNKMTGSLDDIIVSRYIDAYALCPYQPTKGNP
jgi:hypothetical protein